MTERNPRKDSRFSSDKPSYRGEYASWQFEINVSKTDLMWACWSIYNLKGLFSQLSNPKRSKRKENLLNFWHSKRMSNYWKILQHEIYQFQFHLTSTYRVNDDVNFKKYWIHIICQVRRLNHVCSASILFVFIQSSTSFQVRVHFEILVSKFSSKKSYQNPSGVL